MRCARALRTAFAGATAMGNRGLLEAGGIFAHLQPCNAAFEHLYVAPRTQLTQPATASDG